ncbi:hypothetical protein [Alkalispirochaeta alkalica]|uniref:hypothetical protein n=1 Tax=Alkalispirochaeta alkalica TaxID=46356 RepID=UPI00036E0A47|nr:hypothetical protein [Alkalispirochaeta alkalica]
MIIITGILFFGLSLFSPGLLFGEDLGEGGPGEGWTWPMEGSFDVSQGDSASGFVYRLVPRSRDSLLRAVAPGEVIFRSRSARNEILRSSAVPREREFVAIRHHEGFVAGYFSEGALQGFPGPPGKDAQAHAWIDVVLWDELLQEQVNPRLLWSDPEQFARTAIPPLEFFQEGSPSVPSSLQEGEVVLRIPSGRLDVTRLPWEIRILERGELREEARFVFPRDLERLATPSGDIELLRFEARPGRGSLVVEAVRFDRTIQRRTLPFTVRERPADQSGS